MYPKRSKASVGSAERIDESLVNCQEGPAQSRDTRVAGAQHSQSASMDMTAEAVNWYAPDNQPGYLTPGSAYCQPLHTGGPGTHYRTSSQFSASNGRTPGESGSNLLPPYATAVASVANKVPLATASSPPSPPQGSTNLLGRATPTIVPGSAPVSVSPRQTPGTGTPTNEVAVQEKRYAHLFDEHRKLHVVVREKSLEIERMTAERKRLQTEVDYYRVELAAQRRRFYRCTRAVRSDLLRLVTLVDVLLPDDATSKSAKSSPNGNRKASPKPTAPRSRAAQLEAAYAEVQKRLDAVTEQSSEPMTCNLVPESEQWLLETLNLLSTDVLADPAYGGASADASGTLASTAEDAVGLPFSADEVAAEQDSRLDSIQEAREGALRAVEGLAHYLNVLDFGFQTPFLTSPAMLPVPLSIAVNVGAPREAFHGGAGRPVVPVLRDLASA